MSAYECKHCGADLTEPGSIDVLSGDVLGAHVEDGKLVRDDSRGDCDTIQTCCNCGGDIWYDTTDFDYST